MFARKMLALRFCCLSSKNFSYKGLAYDTALKYNKKAGYPNLQPDDLYNPTVNIAI